MVDDCRYPNEAARLAVEGFVIVRVVADRFTRVDRLKANGKLQDEAEKKQVEEAAAAFKVFRMRGRSPMETPSGSPCFVNGPPFV